MPQHDYEFAHQCAVALWLDTMRVRWFHPPNGGNRSAVTGGRLKRQGVKRGVPDIVIIDPPPARASCVGAVVELKPTLAERPGNKPTKEQREWLHEFEQRGWAAAVAYGADEAIRILKELGYARRVQQMRGMR